MSLGLAGGSCLHSAQSTGPLSILMRKGIGSVAVGHKWVFVWMCVCLVSRHFLLQINPCLFPPFFSQVVPISEHTVFCFLFVGSAFAAPAVSNLMSSADLTSGPSFPSSGQPQHHHWTSFSTIPIHGLLFSLVHSTRCPQTQQKGKRLMVRILFHSSLKTYLLLSAASVRFLLQVGGMRIVHKCWFWILKFLWSFLDFFCDGSGGRRWKSTWPNFFQMCKHF